jgi:hypothetical protein
MHKFDAFVDLRTNRSGQTPEDSVWPSFTDVMTVVLMLFMLTMVAVIVRNSELVERLKASVRTEERMAASLEANESVLSNLRGQLALAEEALAKIKMTILLLGEEKARLKDLSESAGAVVADLTARLDAAEAEKNRLIVLLGAREKELAEKTAAADRMIVSVTDRFEARIAALENANRRLSDRLAAEDANGRELELTLARQRQEYSTLEDKYHKLIRPSRTAVGKTVVSIRYYREGGAKRLMFKNANAPEEAAPDYVPLTGEELHRRLGRLRDAYGDRLYVKIVIPEASGLSYNEAWSFTRDMLDRYDYYYRETD